MTSAFLRADFERACWKRQHDPIALTNDDLVQLAVYGLDGDAIERRKQATLALVSGTKAAASKPAKRKRPPLANTAAIVGAIVTTIANAIAPIAARLTALEQRAASLAPPTSPPFSIDADQPDPFARALAADGCGPAAIQDALAWIEARPAVAAAVPAAAVPAAPAVIH